jgi:hypothetical protein
MAKIHTLLGLLATSFVLSSCGEQQPKLPGQEEADIASYLDLTKTQCASILGGDGVRDLTVASSKLKKKAKGLGFEKDYSSPDFAVATAWSISVGMQNRRDACNQFVTGSYNRMAATGTL